MLLLCKLMRGDTVYVDRNSPKKNILTKEQGWKLNYQCGAISGYSDVLEFDILQCLVVQIKSKYWLRMCHIKLQYNFIQFVIALLALWKLFYERAMLRLKNSIQFVEIHFPDIEWCIQTFDLLANHTGANNSVCLWSPDVSFFYLFSSIVFTWANSA